MSRALFRTSLFVLSAALAFAQNAPNAGLQYVETVGIPNWTTAATNYDLYAFNPATRIMYIADRTNHGITAVDTRTNVAIGYMTLPNNGSTNGVLIAIDLQLLAATDGRNNLFVWDLRLPGSGPTQYTIPNIPTAGTTDALDYDPLNHTVYLINGSAPYYFTGVDLVYKTVSSQLMLPGSPELNAFNTVDGMMYQVITDGDHKNAGAGVIAIDPVSNTIKATYLTPTCVPHGIAIDPITNVALLGCGTNQGQIMMNLKDGTIMKQFSDVTGTDLLNYNPNNRRFYTGSGSNVATTNTCPSDVGKLIPLTGVFDALLQGGVPNPRLIGVTCTGRTGHGVGIDTITNNVYIGVRQYPANPTDGTAGVAGVMVFADPAPPGQPLTTQTQATLASVPGSSTQVTLQTKAVGRRVILSATATGVSGKTGTLLVVTSVGNEAIGCAVDQASSKAICGGSLIGDPLIGATSTLSIDGLPVARGMVTAVNPAM